MDAFEYYCFKFIMLYEFPAGDLNRDACNNCSVCCRVEDHADPVILDLFHLGSETSSTQIDFPENTKNKKIIRNVSDFDREQFKVELEKLKDRDYISQFGNQPFGYSKLDGECIEKLVARLDWIRDKSDINDIVDFPTICDQILLLVHDFYRDINVTDCVQEYGHSKLSNFNIDTFSGLFDITTENETESETESESYLPLESYK